MNGIIIISEIEKNFETLAYTVFSNMYKTAINIWHGWSRTRIQDHSSSKNVSKICSQ